MNMKRPEISVIIPVKNAEDTIAECLRAVFTQSWEPYEVIVVDGHSSDETVERAEKFPAKIIYEDYGTTGGARQVGLENAKGKYVAFTDGDCIPEKNWLENLIKGFDEDVMGVGGGVKNIGEGIWEKSIALIMNTYIGSANSVQGRLFEEKRFVKSISGCNSIYRRQTLMSIGGFNTALSINEDTELNKRLSRMGRLLYVPNATVLHNQGRGLKDFGKRVYQFGEGRGKLRLWSIQCVPSLIAPLFIFLLIFAYWLLGLIAVYVLILMVMATRFAIREKNAQYLASVPIAYVIEHFFYSLGLWAGLLRK
jgi:glycosyltransferase involved in cell wall biosynthesis